MSDIDLKFLFIIRVKEIPTVNEYQCKNLVIYYIRIRFIYIQ